MSPRERVNTRNQRIVQSETKETREFSAGGQDLVMRNKTKRPNVATFHLQIFDYTLTVCHMVITVISVDNTTVNWFIKVMVRRRPDKTLGILNT